MLFQTDLARWMLLHSGLILLAVDSAAPIPSDSVFLTQLLHYNLETTVTLQECRRSRSSRSQTGKAPNYRESQLFFTVSSNRSKAQANAGTISAVAVEKTAQKARPNPSNRSPI